MKPIKPYELVLFYHADCPDGFGAAYAFWKKYGNAMRYEAVHHYDEIPSVKGATVYMADIAFDQETMIRLNDEADKFVVLDHHKTAIKSLKDFDFFNYDINHSGAVLSWNYLFEGKTSLMLRYIEDRDLWSWNLPYAEQILAMLDSLPYDFLAWEKFESKLGDPRKAGELISSGQDILDYNRRLMEKMMDSNLHELEIKGHKVKAINIPFFRSEIVGILAEGEGVDFAAAYHYDGDIYKFSLRSRYGFDVSALAEQFPGGGGHAAASGFSVKSLEELK